MCPRFSFARNTISNFSQIRIVLLGNSYLLRRVREFDTGPYAQRNYIGTNSTRRRRTVAAADRCRISKTAPPHSGSGRPYNKKDGRAARSGGGRRYNWNDGGAARGGGGRPLTTIRGGAAQQRRTPCLFPGLAGELHPDRTNANKHRCSLHAVPNGFRYSTTQTGMIGKFVGGVYQRTSGIFIPGCYLSDFQRKRLPLNGRVN